MRRLVEMLRWRRMVVMKVIKTSIPNNVHFLRLDGRHTVTWLIRRLCNYLNPSSILSSRLMVAIRNHHGR